VGGAQLWNVSSWLFPDIPEGRALRPLSAGERTFLGYTVGVLADRPGMLDQCLKHLSARNAEKPSLVILTGIAGAKRILS